MFVEDDDSGGRTVLRISGTVKVGGSVRDFEETLHHAVSKSVGPLVLDLTDLEYMDSTAIGVLVGVLHRMKSENRDLALVNPRERIAALLRIARLDTLFEIYGSVAEAMAALDRREGGSGVQ